MLVVWCMVVCVCFCLLFLVSFFVFFGCFSAYLGKSVWCVFLSRGWVGGVRFCVFPKTRSFLVAIIFCWRGFGRFLVLSRGYWRHVHIFGFGFFVRWRFGGIWVVWACIGVWAVHFGMWAWAGAFRLCVVGAGRRVWGFLLYVASRLCSTI